MFFSWRYPWSFLSYDWCEIVLWGNIEVTSLFNNSPTLYIVYFIDPRRLFYRQKIGRLFWFWRKSGLECTKYSISHNLFRGETHTPLPMEEVHYYVSGTTTTRRPALTTPSLPASIPPSSNAAAMTSRCFCRPSRVSCCLNFCKGSSTLFPTEKAG